MKERRLQVLQLFAVGNERMTKFLFGKVELGKVNEQSERC
jgi:hypothetical protein